MSGDDKPLPRVPSLLVPGSTVRKRSQGKFDADGREIGSHDDDADRFGRRATGKSAIARSQSRASTPTQLSWLVNPFSPRLDAFNQQQARLRLDQNRPSSSEVRQPQETPGEDEGEFSSIPLTPIPGSSTHTQLPPSLAPRLATQHFSRSRSSLGKMFDFLKSRSPRSAASSKFSSSSPTRRTIAPTVVSSASSPVKPSYPPTRMPSTQAPSIARHLAHKFPLPASLPDGMEDSSWLGLQSIVLWEWPKWILLFSVIVVFSYGISGFTLTLLTWFRAFDKADVFVATNQDILVFLLFAAILISLNSVLGLCGTLLNSRPILAFYAILLFPCFIALVIPAYVAYKRDSFQLDRKMNLAWSEWWDDSTKLVIQNSLHCCGYYSPLHQAVFSKWCYARVPPTIQGCKAALIHYESGILRKVYRTLFAIVPVHLGSIVVALLCSNHVTKTFGKGLTPPYYRLTALDVRENAELVSAYVRQRQAESGIMGATLKPPALKNHSMERNDVRIAWGSRALNKSRPIGLGLRLR